MRLHEHEAADLLERMGIPVPRRGLAGSAGEALEKAGQIGYPVVLKAQVLAGGRGLAGGIRPAASPGEAEKAAAELFGRKIQGARVEQVLVAGKAAVERELYLGITVDGYAGQPVVLAGTEGGVLIEEKARRAPEKIASRRVDPAFGFYPYQAREVAAELGLRGKLLQSCADVLERLYRVFERSEALIAEINPLAVLPGGGLLALDAKIEVDDAALFRLGPSFSDPLARIEHPLERRGREIGVTYVDLGGDIGIISSGAGLGMATMDIVGRGLRPANFLETGGGITEELLYRCMELLMLNRGLRAVVINLYGGINPIHEGARGIARYIQEHEISLPVVAKALGNRQEETWEILRSAGVEVVTAAATETAVDRLIELLKPLKGPPAPGLLPGTQLFRISHSPFRILRRGPGYRRERSCQRENTEEDGRSAG